MQPSGQAGYPFSGHSARSEWLVLLLKLLIRMPIGEGGPPVTVCFHSNCDGKTSDTGPATFLHLIDKEPSTLG